MDLKHEIVQTLLELNQTKHHILRKYCMFQTV